MPFGNFTLPLHDTDKTDSHTLLRHTFCLNDCYSNHTSELGYSELGEFDSKIEAT